MVNKKRGEVNSPERPNTLEEIQNELPKIVEGHEGTAEAIQRCVDVCGPFSSDKLKKKKALKTAEDEAEDIVQSVNLIDERKKELLREMSTIGMGQVDKIQKLLRKIQHLNEETFRANLAAPMARHELMTLLAEQGLRLPLWVSRVSEHPPPLVGAISANDAFKLNVGDYCAAYCEDMWILGEVRGIADNGRYEVRDVDDNEKPVTVLARRRVIPLPRYRADPVRDSHALFPKNAWILALYPQTTVFYKGIVEEPPKNAADPYKVAFDDSTFHGGFSPPLEVPQRYVLSFREVAYKPREKLENEKCRVREKGREKSVTNGRDKSVAREKITLQRQLSKEEIREQKELEKERKKEENKVKRELEKERKRAEKVEAKIQAKLRMKAEKKAAKEKIKREKKEAKQKEKEKRRKEKNKEKKRLAKERRLLRKLEREKEQEEKKEGAAKSEENQEKDVRDRNQDEDNNEQVRYGEIEDGEEEEEEEEEEEDEEEEEEEEGEEEEEEEEEEKKEEEEEEEEDEDEDDDEEAEAEEQEKDDQDQDDEELKDEDVEENEAFSANNSSENEM